MINSFFMAFVSAYNAHRKITRAATLSANLSDGYPKVLMNLKSMEGCLQKELAEACRVEPATMTVLLRGMMKSGLIRREETHVSGGKRAFRVYLTEKGLEMTDEIFRIFEETNCKALEGMSEEEVQTFISFLNRIQKNLEN